MEALAILLICLVRIGVGNSTRDATFRICKNRRLESDLISYTKVRSLVGCATKCTNDISSNSANFIKSSKTCELYNDVLAQTQCDQLGSNGSTTVIIKKNNPCKNNQPFDGTSCICSPPLYGEFCQQGGPKDCGDINQNGYFDAYPDDGMGKIRVYCWVHRTMLFAAPKGGFTPKYYNKTWHEYKYGFGDIKVINREVIGAYWLGNENIHRLTNGAINYVCAFWFAPMTSSIYNRHFHFKVDSETENYTIDYDTSDGESHRKLEKNAPFSTADRNNRECAAINGVGFWFDNVCSKTPPLFGSYILSGNTHFYDGFWTYLWRI